MTHAYMMATMGASELEEWKIIYKLRAEEREDRKLTQRAEANKLSARKTRRRK